MDIDNALDYMTYNPDQAYNALVRYGSDIQNIEGVDRDVIITGYIGDKRVCIRFPSYFRPRYNPYPSSMNMSVRQGMKDIASSHLKDISDYIVYDNDSIVLKKVFEGGPSISIEERV